jgi:transposase
MQLEARRMRAAELLRRGMRASDVAKAVGSSKSSVTRWKEVLEKSGVEGLKAKPHPGPTPRLSKGQKRWLIKILLRGPLAAGFPTDLWTCPRVAAVIERTFGVHYHEGHVWHLLRRLGWSCQKPERRARERDEDAIQRWRQEDWPRIKKSPSQAHPHRFSR